MARRYQHSLEEISTMILQAAENIVVEEGYPALNARKIAMEIHYTVGSIYMVFESMTDLVLHLNVKTLDEIVDYLHDNQDPTSTSPLENLAKNYFRFAEQNFHRWQMLFDFSPPKNKPLPTWYQQHLKSTFTKIGSLLELDMPPGVTPIDAGLAIKTLWGGLYGIYALSAGNKLGAIPANQLEASLLLLVRNAVCGLQCCSKTKESQEQ